MYSNDTLEQAGLYFVGFENPGVPQIAFSKAGFFTYNSITNSPKMVFAHANHFRVNLDGSSL
jgi:hypothetical protein